MRPITGAELTVVPLGDEIDDTPPAPARLTLLVEDARGYRNLCRLLTIAHSHTHDGPSPIRGFPSEGGIRRRIGAALARAGMAEVIRTVVSRIDLEPGRPDPAPVVIRGITLHPRHGTPVVVRRVGKPAPGSRTPVKQTTAGSS